MRFGEHDIPLPKVRNALDYLKKQFGVPHPLADQKFEVARWQSFNRSRPLLVNSQLVIPARFSHACEYRRIGD
jgi:hypothetical protein